MELVDGRVEKKDFEKVEMKKLFIRVNVDWFFLSHRKDIALAAQRAGWDVTIVTADTGKLKDIEAPNDNCFDLIDFVGCEGIDLYSFIYSQWHKHAKTE